MEHIYRTSLTEEEENNLLKQWINQNDMPVQIKPYTKEEYEIRMELDPTFWTQRDWYDHSHSNNGYRNFE